MARTEPTALSPSDRLMTALAAFDDAQLTSLLAARPDLARPAPADLAALARRAAAWPSVAACYRDLDLWCQQVVQALCLVPPATTVGQLAQMLGLSGGAGVADVETAVDRLASRALVQLDADRVHLVPAFAELAWPARLGPPAQIALETRTHTELVVVARRLGLAPSRTKAGMLDALVHALADPDVVRRVIADGPPGTAELARHVAHDGPTTLCPGGLYGSGVSDRTSIGWLVNRGVLVPDTWSTAVMPGEVGLALRGGQPFPEPANRPPVLAPEEVGVARADAAGSEVALRLVADVTTLLDDWSTATPKLLKAGGVGIRDLRRMAKTLGRDEMGTARLVELAGTAGLVVADPVTDTALPTPAYDDWLDLGPAQRWAQLVAGWVDALVHVGLAGEASTKDKAIPPLHGRVSEAGAARRRRDVLSVLASVEPGWAVVARDLAPRTIWEGPMQWSGGPGSPSQMIEWVVEEAELLGVTSGRALTTAGRLAVTGRLDEATAALALHAPPVSSTFVVQADLTVIAPGELAVPVRAELELLADVESKGAATVYRLSEATLRRGFDAGRTAAGITSFLTDHAGRPVPQSLVYLVADLGRKFGQVRVGGARCYVRSDDPSLVAEITRARRTARLGLRLLAPTVAVTDAAPEEVLTSLRAAGYLPAAEDAAGDLVVTRPERRRATPRPALGGLGPREADRSAELRRRAGMPPDAPLTAEELAELVGRLRRAPVPAASSSSRREPPANPPGSRPPRPALPQDPFPDLDFDVDLDLDLELFDEPARPMEIVKGAGAVADLLAQAFMEDWSVRLAYTNRNGRSSQLNVVVLAPADDQVMVEVLPDGTERTLTLTRVEWARVLTEAEEELLY